MEELTYQQATEELEALLQTIEGGVTDVDELMQHVRRATELVRYCERKLRTAEGTLGQLFGAGDQEAN